MPIILREIPNTFPEFHWVHWETEQGSTHCFADTLQVRVNPLSPNIHIQILQTDLHTFPLRISWENLVKDQIIIFLFVIILLILIDFAHDSLWISLGENWFWALLGLKGLIKPATQANAASILHATTFSTMMKETSLQ